MGNKRQNFWKLSLQLEIIVYITHYIKQNRKLSNHIVKPNKLPKKQEIRDEKYEMLGDA